MIGALLARRGVRRTYDALNDRDLDRFLAAWSDDAIFTFPGDVWASGTVEGKPAIRGWFEAFLARFPHLRFDVDHVCVARPLALGASQHVTAHWRIDLTSRDGVSNRNEGITLIRLRRGRVAAAQDFLASTGDDFRRVWGEAPPSSRGQSSSK